MEIEKNYYELNFTLDEIREDYDFEESCQNSVPQALRAFFEAENFEDTLRNAISIGGDSDTIAAIACSIADAYYGIPEKIAKQTITKILHDYNKDFIFNWLQTQNCKAWIHEHDKTLGYRSEYVKQANDVTIYYENGDVYNGSLKMGKRNGNGSYREISAKRVYNGEWVNDERNGVGSLTSEDLQYIYDGEWKNGMMNGNGQLIDKKSKYSGTFIK